MSLVENNKNIKMFIAENSTNHFINDFNNFEIYSLKELHKICDYYNIKYTKLKKNEIINTLLLFEKNYLNCCIVSRRRIMWGLIEELRNDTKMSKYILW